MMRAIKESPGGLTQAELAERMRLPRTTIHRILSALEDEQLVTPGVSARSRYRIGPEVTRLAAAASRDLVSLVHPLLVDFSSRLAETVDLSVLDGDQVTFVDQVDAPHRLRAASAVGESFPLHSCAPGKALLAALPQSRVSQLLPTHLITSTARTVTSTRELLDQLEGVRQTGIAFDYEEQNEGICAAGIAIALPGQLMAVSIPIPAQRFHGREREWASQLLAFKDEVLAAAWV